MDLNGRKEIVGALTSGLAFDINYVRWFDVKPLEHELFGGEDASEDALSSVGYVDIVTHAEPWRVLESLRRARLLDHPDSPASVDLSLQEISNNGNAFFLTFKDNAELEA